MVETLTVVAIMVILFAVAAPNVIAAARQFEASKLNSRAQSIYNTVQNRVSALQSNGKLQALSDRIDSSHLVATKPADYKNSWATDEQWTALQTVDGHSYRAYDVYYVRGRSDTAGSDTTSGTSDTAVTDLLMTNNAGQISRDLYDGGWLVEVSPTTGEVYAVFYWEDAQSDLSTESITDAYKQLCEWRKEGVEKGTGDAVLNENHVGYYCGGQLSKAVHKPHERFGDLRWRLVNDEELYVMICSDDLADLEPSKLTVTVTVRGKNQDGEDAAWRYAAKGSDLNMQEGSDEVDVILDSLRSAKTTAGATEQMSFYNIMCCDFGGTLYQDADCTKKQSTHDLAHIISPGSDIDVSVELSYASEAGDVSITSKSADVLASGWAHTGSGNTLTTNSTVGAFEAGSGDNANSDGTVYLWATRHLRNISIMDDRSRTYNWEDDSKGARTGFTHLAFVDANTTVNKGGDAHYSGNAIDRDGDELMKNLQTGDIDFAWENNDTHCVSYQSRTADATTGKLNPLAYFAPIRFYGENSYKTDTRDASITGQYSDTDGNAAGHELRNFVIRDDSGDTADYVGLFRELGSPVSYLNLVNFKVTGRNFVGALAGNMVNTYVDLDDVRVYVNKMTNGAIDYASCGITSTGSYVGGIIGHALQRTSHMNNCSASINVTANTSDSVCVGGLIGQGAMSEVSGCSYGMDNNRNGALGVPTVTAGRDWAGGIVGKYNREKGSFTGCITLGNVTSGGLASTGGTGGIAGYALQADSPSTCTFKQCYVGCVPDTNAQGKIVAAATTSTITGGLNSGGITGYLYAGSYTDCHVMGNVASASKDCAGGIGGFVETSTDFDNCSFEGSVSGNASVGGIVGQAKASATIKNCTVGADDSSKIAAITAASNYVGGIGGLVHDGSSLESCTAYVTVRSNGTTDTDGRAGGLLGADVDDKNSTGGATVTECSVGSASNPATISGVRHNIGGLIGKHGKGAITGADGGSYVFANVSSDEGGNHIGGLLGTDNGSTSISNYNVGSASAPASVRSNNPSGRTDQDCDAEFVGGISGQHKSGNVSNCHVVAQVSGCSKVGGLIGDSGTSGKYSDSGKSDEIVDCSFSYPITDLGHAGIYCPAWPHGDASVYVGGAFGTVTAAKISNCSVVADIYCLSNGTNTNLTSQGNYAGGFAGYITGASPLTIDSCHVSGTFDSGNAKLAYMCTDLNYQGGFVGRIDGASAVAIKNCYSAYGVVPVSDNRTENESMYVGGFVGYMDNKSATIDSCYVASVGWSADVTNRYPVASGATNAVGGFVGALEYGTISNCYTTANTSGCQLSGGFAGIAAPSGNSNAVFKNCTAYGLTARSVDATVTIGGFCASKGNGTATFTNCKFLQYSGYNDWTNADSSCNGTAQSYEQLATSSNTGHPYTSALGTTFPFATVIGTDHYGDWPAKSSSPSGSNTFSIKDSDGHTYTITAQPWESFQSTQTSIPVGTPIAYNGRLYITGDTNWYGDTTKQTPDKISGITLIATEQVYTNAQLSGPDASTNYQLIWNVDVPVGALIYAAQYGEPTLRFNLGGAIAKGSQFNDGGFRNLVSGTWARP